MKKRGFTMVELMIVIAIIAILASIIMPKMSGARERAKLTACKANFRQILTAMTLYSQENNGYYTPCTTSTQTYYGNCSYLVPEYMRTAPRCPTGQTYTICANHTGLWSAPAGCTLVYSECAPSTHAGLANFCPYTWVGGAIKEN